MKKTLYLECYSGISGDMAVAALLDLGADRKVLEEALASLPVKGFETRISRVNKAGLDACDFHVILDAEHENHDHDMGYLHGSGEHTHTHEEHHHHHDHEEEHHHHHDHEEGHHHHHDHGDGHAHTHTHEHRGLPEILEIIHNSLMTDDAKALAAKIFRIIASAESKAHGIPADQVHFHEVGAVDSIVDIVAVSVCATQLGITDVIIPGLYEGTGTVRCQHGILPVPVPATAHIVEESGLHLHITDTRGEFVTPTGAAIAAALMTSDRLPGQFKILRTGIGAGKRSYERPSLLRAMLIEETAARFPDADAKKQVYKLETNIDDCSGEALGFAMERLLEAGARDVYYTPVFMKKNRPAYMLSVICLKEQVKELEDIIFRETTTIGIRRIPVERTTLVRKMESVQTPYGEVQVKVCDPESGTRYYPEYESVAALCRENGISYPEMYQIAAELCRKQ